VAVTVTVTVTVTETVTVTVTVKVIAANWAVFKFLALVVVLDIRSED
jgi:hypothetical protein